MIVEEQTRLKAFQDAQTVYAGYLHRRSAGERVSFEELVAAHEALEPILVGLHETFSRASGGGWNPKKSSADSTSSGATTVVDRRGAHNRPGALATAVDPVTRTPRASTPDKRYVPQGELARGGMGAILKVWDRHLGRTLAMKVLLDDRAGPALSGAEHLARFLQEAQVIARLDHPGIVPVHDVGFDPEGRPYFTMRYVDGLDLDDVFDRARTGRDGWNLGRAVAAIVKTCQTMAYAHARGIVHRDLKPGNVMVGRFGEAYVIDWGLAKVLDGNSGGGAVAPRRPRGPTRRGVNAAAKAAPPRSGGSIQSSDGVVVGTPAFMSPEQARGLGQALDPRADIYSLGAILYTLLAGSAPYAPLDGSRLSAAEMTDLVLEGPPSPVRELAGRAPSRLIAICEKAMARNPADRYQSAMDMAEDIQLYLDGRTASPPIGVAARMRDWVSGNRVVAGFAGVAVLLVTLLPGVVGVSPDAGRSRPAAEQALHEAPEREPEPKEPRCVPKPGEQRCVAKSTSGCGDAQSS